MFLVNDTLEERKTKIERFMSEGEPAIALLIAAADLERTMRRAIIALASEPTLEVREAIEEKYRTIGVYPKAWRRFVEGAGKAPLTEVLPNFEAVLGAFNLRNELIHGVRGTAEWKYAHKQVAIILDATERLTNFASQHGIDLTAKLKARRRTKAKT
jgi:hypothetical protein